VRKVAVFVEGLTEQEFVVELVSAVVGARGVNVVLGRQWKGKVVVEPSMINAVLDFLVLVVNCSNDEQVKTQVREQYPSLVAAGYTAIIGLRDVYPLARADIPAIQAGLSPSLPTGVVTPEMHLAVMEVEAWFLAESTHFSRLHPSLAVPFIVAGGIDVAGTNGEAWGHPAGVLHAIYRLVGMSYMSPKGQKTKRRVQRTLKALSFDELYVTVRGTIPSFDAFVTSLEGALF
jgi:hypothetical protein